MHAVRVNTPDQLAEILKWIFFREDGVFKEYGDPSYSFEELETMLQIDSTKLIDPAIEVNSDEWYEANEQIDGAALEQYSLIDRKIPLFTEFKPGVLFWMLEDDFDRIGDLAIRLFQYRSNEELTITSFRNWQKDEQQQHDRHCKMIDDLLLLASNTQK